MKRKIVLVCAAALALPALATGCSSKKRDDGTTPIADKTLPPIVVKDDSPDLMLTWIDPKGETHVELRPIDVPAEGRAMVRVVVSDREDGTRELFYVADLTKKREDGTYPTQTMRRRDWESEIEKRRAEYLAKVAPPPVPTGSGAAGEPPRVGQDARSAAVIIYGASWCGPCHEAERYLKSKGVRYVMKDVEETPGAAAEMREKLSRAGRHGGSIPVIDVRGEILIGFSAAAIDRALAKSGGSGTML